jgi:hypothetical protein
MTKTKAYIGVAIILSALSLPAFPARSQDSIKVSIKKSALAWDWTQGDGGVADAFNAKCGTVSGTYTKSTVVSATLRTVPLASVIVGPGENFCAVTAINGFEESAASNEVSFNAGDAPLKPTNNRIVTQ